MTTLNQTTGEAEPLKEIYKDYAIGSIWQTNSDLSEPFNSLFQIKF